MVQKKHTRIPSVKLLVHLLKDLVTHKELWRKEQARLPMAEKARIAEILRDRHLSFRLIRSPTETTPSL